MGELSSVFGRAAFILSRLTPSLASRFRLVFRWDFLPFTETVFDRPASERQAKDLSQSPAVTTGHTIRQEVFGFIGEDISSYDQCALVADELVGVSLPPARCPTNFPNFAATMRLFDAILLWSQTN